MWNQLVKNTFLLNLFCNSGNNMFELTIFSFQWKWFSVLGGSKKGMLINITRKYELADCWQEVCRTEEQVAELGCSSNCFYESKWCVLCSPHVTRDVRDWITAPIDYFSHHCPSESPGQEIYTTPIGLLRLTALDHCLQSGWLAVGLCEFTTVTWLGLAFTRDYLISELFSQGSQI